MLDLELTGSGPAGGFPVPGCPCAICARAVADDPAARPAVEPGPGLRSRRPAELLVAGVRFDAAGAVDGHALAAGDERSPAGLRVRCLAPAPATVLLVEPAAHPPLLWAPGAGLLPPPVLDALLDALGGARLGAVFLGPAPERDPDDPQGDPAQLDSARTLARLRALGAAGPATACVLVGLGHRQGGIDRLALDLAAWGARAPADGARLALAEGPMGDAEGAGAGGGLAGRTLVLGGASSGKSAIAEDLVSAEPEVLYTATGRVVEPDDDPDGEWALRVRRHQQRRPPWWGTAETQDVAELLVAERRPILLDSVGTWLTGMLDRTGAWDERDGWRDELAAYTDELVRAWRGRRAPLVAVSDEVGLGVVPPTPAGRLFRDELGRLNRRLAEESERVLVVVAGQLLTAPSAFAGPRS